MGAKSKQLELDHRGYQRQFVIMFHSQKHAINTISHYSMGHGKDLLAMGGGGFLYRVKEDIFSAVFRQIGM